MELLGDKAQVEARFGLFGVVLVLTRCTGCVEPTIRSEISFDTSDGTPRWRESCGILFQSIWR
jgi:hypothetical protein